MKVDYYTCDNCGARIEDGIQLRVSLSKIKKIFVKHRSSFDLCPNCFAALFPKQDSQIKESDRQYQFFLRCKECMHFKKNGLCGGGGDNHGYCDKFKNKGIQ